MHLKLTAAYKTDVGKQREQNEDNAFLRTLPSDEGDSGLFIVADGMGGYHAGEVASKLAVDTMRDALNTFFVPLSEQPTTKLSAQSVSDEATIQLHPVQSENQRSKPQKTRKLPETPLAKSIEDQLTFAIQQANKAIVRYGEQTTSARGLGCTVTSALIRNNQAYIANIGDSRTYLLRDGKLSTLTKDHSLVAKLVEAKQIEPDEVYSHPQRNLIYRSLGAGHSSVEVDVFHQALHPNDILLLCSDGLWEMVRPEDLQKMLSEKTDPQQICDSLIERANANGGEDNITALVVQVSEA